MERNDLGIVNSIDNDLAGVQFSLVGVIGGNMKGFQNDWLWGSVGGEMQGVQMSAVNTAGHFEGAPVWRGELRPRGRDGCRLCVRQRV